MARQSRSFMKRGILFAVLTFLCGSAYAAEVTYDVGVAEMDITPDYPVRLSGFGFRRAESEGVTTKISAKALAIREADGAQAPAVLLTVDNVGIPDYMTREVAERLEKKAKLEPARLAVTCTHTHTAPMLKGVCSTLYGRPIPVEHQEHIDRYTRELTDKLEEVALAAIAALKPGKLELGIGSAGFAINRRTPGGPVDHDLPVLAVRDADGKLRAIYTSYACHCVTLSNNKVSGDWAGYARELIEKNHPGVMALTSVGCGADSNPSSNPVGDRADIAEAQGKQIADEVERMLKVELSPVTGALATKMGEVTLAFDKPPTREEFEQKAKSGDEYGRYHARVQLDRLDRGEKLLTEINYSIQTWTFGDQLAMVFLPGEVVVDYSLRLKREFDRSRLWMNAYSNAAPCYIPSERILKEGGYEGAGAMMFYDKPTKLAPGLEAKIVGEIHRQLPKNFLAPTGTEGVAPRSPEQSRQSIRTKSDFEVELVAAEPLITSPVAIDWGANGRLWVCEMFDYPTGGDGNWSPGGRVKVLRDTDGDGRYDNATIFLEKIPFPTGVTAWGKGVLVCAAPDILYAEDTNGDGKADKVEKIFSGFETTNYQARVNSLTLGLDNWIYGANGLLGGTITGGGGSVDIRNHDFRFRTMGSPMETVTGLTQQGRVRDDWGRWFGCNNSQPLLYYPHEERYFRRNPHVAAPPSTIAPAGGSDGGRVYPVSRTLERFNDPGSVNHFTSACGIGIYRDTLLGEEYSGNAFVAEPVHNLVHRMILSGEGTGLSRARAADERESDFFASSDNWSRPVQVRTGPDGALYVVDMYRFLIEHPRWIPPERLAKIDVRAGADKGRIYRVRAKGKALRDVPDLTKLGAAELAVALDSPNGTERDRVHVELLTRQDRGAVAGLEKVASEAKLPQVRVQALCALEGLGSVSTERSVAGLKDGDAHVRQQAVRLCEPLLREGDPEPILETLLAMADDSSHLVREQVALTLGEWKDARAGRALATMARASLNDAEMRAAILSSCARHCGAVLDAVMKARADAAGREAWIPALVATAAGSTDDRLMSNAVLAVLPPADGEVGKTHFEALASLMDALDRRKVALSDYVLKRPELRDAQPRVVRTLEAARRLAGDDQAAEVLRAAAIHVLGRANAPEDELNLLCDLVIKSSPETLRAAALTALRRQSDAKVANRLITGWQKTSPAARAEIENLLLSRDDWTTALLMAVKARKIQPNEISLTDRKRLAESANERIRGLASEVLPQATGTKRAEVIRRYQAVGTLSGTASRGAEGFSKNCAACHLLNGIGREVGPDLGAIRNKDVDYFVKNILDPSAVVEPRFVNYVILMKDGRTLSGVIKAETTNNVTLATGGGPAAENLARADIKSIRATSTSLMPDGLEAAFTPQQMADLVAFLKSGAAPKQFAGNSPKLVEPGTDGSLILNASAAEIYGERALFENEYKNVGFWEAREDQVAWSIRIKKAMEFDVLLDYACAANSAGNSFAIEVSGRSLTGVVAETGADWSTYKQVRAGKLQLEAGQHRLVVRPDAPVRGALMDLRAVALVAPGMKPHWTVKAPAPPADELLRDPVSVALLILDKSKSTAAREAVISANPQFAAELIGEMTKDLAAGSGAEYERIPWIWRVAIACGKRNDAAPIKSVLAVSLPELDQPLRDWQAVVIGGGIINGISQRDVWPAERMREIVGKDAAMTKRWERALELASTMADAVNVPNGTRYDALRMLGAQPCEKCGAQLSKYLSKKNDTELQMGAVSALADVREPQSTEALLSALAELTEGNRKLALDALVRDGPRAMALLDAVEAKKIDPSMIGKEAAGKLKDHPDETVRKRALALLKSDSR
jgi:putative membrane-bound dehydrogenase-like protein